MNDILHLLQADQYFPPLLKEIPSPPKELYVRGDLSLLSAQYHVAVVGTRQISLYGQKVLQEIIPPLVRSGAVIVSGLAYGIDALAHEIALEHGGKCIAVLGNGLDEVYPRQHRPLADRILMSGGSIISEFPKGMPPLKQHFPARNRIISGLSRATLVIEAKQKSGSLITARFAIEQGREVFAVPGSIFEEKQQGTNQLIAQGAQPILSADDLLEKLHMIPYTQSHIAPPTLSFSSPEEETLFHLLKDIRSIDQIVHDAALPISQLNQLLILMEMKGLIRHLGGMMYTRV